MRILIINEKLLEGGAEVYVHNLRKIMKSNNDVFLLCFENNFKEKINYIEDKSNIININTKKGIYAVINKLFFNLSLYIKIRKIIRRINPDKIILNNIVYNPKTQLKALKGHDVYQVIHDYSVVCPKSTCVKDNLQICSGYRCNNCMKNCKYHNSKIVLFFKLFLTKKIEKLRKKYVKVNISPSLLLKEYLHNFKYNAISINNPIEMESYINKIINLNNKKKRYIYVGAINEKKGIFKFIEYFNEFSKEKDVELYIIGNLYPECKEIMKRNLELNSKIKYLGEKEHRDALKEIQKSDFIIMPSLWIENYPTTVLEGMSLKTLVIASDRGGMKEMLDNGRGMIFNILDKNSVLNVLNETFCISTEKYEKIINNAYMYVKNNNNYEVYKRKFLDALK